MSDVAKSEINDLLVYVRKIKSKTILHHNNFTSPAFKIIVVTFWVYNYYFTKF